MTRFSKYIKIGVIVTLVLASLVFNSCTKVIDFDVSEANIRLVIDGSVTSELIQHKVKISKTGSYFSGTRTPVVSGASIQVSDGDSTWLYFEKTDEPGTYLSQTAFKAEQGKTYSIKVQVEGQEYTASEAMQIGATLDSLDIQQFFKPIPFENAVDSSFTLSVWGQEVGGQRNYYMWKYKINGSFGRTDSLQNIYFLDDKGIDGAYIPGYPIYNIDPKEIQPGDTLSLYGYTITDQYFQFLRSVLLETFWRGGGPWDGPPANIPTNFSNGALGYFWVAPVSIKSRIIQ
jgi:hypothetical protein